MLFTGSSKLLRFLWMNSPDIVFRRLAIRIRGRRFDYTQAAVRRLAEESRPGLLIDRWERYCRVLRSRGFSEEADELTFSGACVFELGSGPLLGWAPLAIFLGAESYDVCEPNATLDAFADPFIVEGYFQRFYGELCANYGTKMSFTEFLSRLRRVRSISLPAVKERDGFDRIISNSVLEHIPAKSIIETFSNLNHLARSGAKYLHAVDFGPHGAAASVLDLYRVSRQADPSRGLINLLKPSEYKAMLESNGFSCQVCNYKVREVNRAHLHSDWARFAESDLGCLVAILVGETKSKDEIQKETG